MRNQGELLAWVRNNSELGDTKGKCPKCGCSKFYIHEEVAIAKVVSYDGNAMTIEPIRDTEGVYTVDCAGIGCDWSEIIAE